LETFTAVEFGYLLGLNLDDWTLYTVNHFP